MIQNKQRLITASVTLAAAAVTAHLMQSGGGTPGQAPAASVAAANAATVTPNVAAPVAPPAPNPVTVAAQVDPTADPAQVAETPVADTPSIEMAAMAEPVATPASSVAASLPVPPKDTLMPAPLPQVGTDLQNRMATTAEVEAPLINELPRNEFGLSCGPILSASVNDAAMVGLTLTAPCRGTQTVTIHHGALAFTAQLDHLGIYTVKVPALQREAMFTVDFADGASVQADVDVPLADTMERAALVYEGNTGLQIHALEFGAEYGEDGHVWADAPRDVASALQAGGGYMTVLGDTNQPKAMLAQVYTYPGDTAAQGGVVRLSVEAEVTALNCATEVTGQTIEPTLAGNAQTVAMTVSMPDCTAIGEFLVLKNLLRDLRIASN